MTTITILGAGPGGYVAALRAAQMGADVHLIDMGQVGGTCLNVGCIPTKALLHAGDFYHTASAGAVPGVDCGAVTADWDEIQNHKGLIVTSLSAASKVCCGHTRFTCTTAEPASSRRTR